MRGASTVWPQLKRWLYRGGRPGRFAKLVNDGFAALHASGIGPPGWVTLEVMGRKSGRAISFPLAMTVVDGERYLVSMLGKDAAWVRNVSAAGGVAVLRRAGAESVRLEEIAIERRAPVLKAYLRDAPGARPHFPIDKGAALSDFAAIAADFPVFRVLSDRVHG